MTVPRQAAGVSPSVVLGALAALYVLTIAILAASGSYFFVRKSAIVPLFCLAALASRRFTEFARDWAVFLGFAFLFDALRGTLFALIARWDLPVYMGYAIGMERALLGGTEMPVLLQDVWFEGTIGWFERLLIVVHASHFVFFLMVGLAVWLVRREAFARYCAVMILVMYAGLLAYALVPTVPPWMAAADYEVIAPVERISGRVHTGTIPGVFAALATNPVAAMPSLHAAFPAAAALVALHVFGRRTWWTVAYTAVAAVSVVYLGEHYLVDVLAGWLLAAAAYLLVFRWRSSRAEAAAGLNPEIGTLRRHAVAAVALGAVLVTSAEALGMLKTRLGTPFVPSTAFIQRELQGISPKAHYYSELRALMDADTAAR